MPGPNSLFRSNEDQRIIKVRKSCVVCWPKELTYRFCGRLPGVTGLTEGPGFLTAVPLRPRPNIDWKKKRNKVLISTKKDSTLNAHSNAKGNQLITCYFYRIAGS